MGCEEERFDGDSALDTDFLFPVEGRNVKKVEEDVSDRGRKVMPRLM
jgi:hypothetical protein